MAHIIRKKSIYIGAHAEITGLARLRRKNLLSQPLHAHRRPSLAPGMKYGGDADLGAEPYGVGGDGLQRHGGDPHQQCIDDRLVLESDLGDCRRQGEDHMEVSDRQQIGVADEVPWSDRIG